MQHKSNRYQSSDQYKPQQNDASCRRANLPGRKNNLTTYKKKDKTGLK
jgi:hypothetical protein